MTNIKDRGVLSKLRLVRRNLEKLGKGSHKRRVGDPGIGKEVIRNQPPRESRRRCRGAGRIWIVEVVGKLTDALRFSRKPVRMGEYMELETSV